MQTFLKFVAWVSDNRFWIMPVVGIGVMGLLLRTGWVLIKNDESRNFWV